MSKNNKKVSLWERYLTKEIGIEFKACLYFYAVLFYYCIYRVICGVWDASIIHMAEMILLTYCIGYLQVYVFWNFDEAEQMGIWEMTGIAVCTGIYASVAGLCGWFGKNIWVILGFALYVIFTYLCVFYIYKTRRSIDEKLLNDDLSLFKARNMNIEEKD